MLHTLRCASPWLTLALLACAPTGQVLSEASQAIYIRNDTDRTTVVSPRSQVTAVLREGTELGASYAVDVWTGASIDVRTAATQAIHETRHELGLRGAQALSPEVLLSSSYRFSVEPDYVSHGGVLGVAADLAKRNTTVALDAFASRDTVGRAHDPGFSQGLDSLGGRATFSQVLHAGGVLQVAYEATGLSGFQASVYRWVAIGADGTCAGLSPYCIPERVPDERLRHAATAALRQALGTQLSCGVDYRFYFDSWGLGSHTVSSDISWTSRDATVEANVRYRYYTQGEADFYRPRYFDLQDTAGFVTRDRKLSTHDSHRVSASTTYRLPGPGPYDLRLGVRTSVSRIDYAAFVGLDHVYVLELSGFVGIEQ